MLYLKEAARDNEKDSNVIIEVENKNKPFMAHSNVLNHIFTYKKILDKHLWKDINQNLAALQIYFGSERIRFSLVTELPPHTEKPNNLSRQSFLKNTQQKLLVGIN
ncbi:hypothetical protein Glove_117g213 [Diversispora epigaea]|uniref:Uncharacterized protein n=1 Tax=Diversispora epigaea TaxID=1348612 RepID=A0A397J0L2_9GLOM|nr:hypothetical protein Glove_117g213 [Diversispora epigaea]